MIEPPASYSNWQTPTKKLGVIDPGLTFQYEPPGLLIKCSIFLGWGFPAMVDYQWICTL